MHRLLSFERRRTGALLALAAALMLAPCTALAQEPAARPPARVMLLGLFHFDNPGLDAVRYTAIDVMQPAVQAELEALADRLTRFAPTKLLLEYRPASDAAINARYAAYREGRFELPKNEIYQLGFRIARRAGLAQVHGFDVEAPASDDALWKQLPQVPATERRLMALIEAESRRLDQAHRSLPLAALLAMGNTAAEALRNKGFYMLLNGVGAQEQRFLGADAAAHWWQRNMRMYALVQMHAQPGERVLVIAGSGHTAVLRDLLQADAERVADDVLPLLQAPGAR